MTIKIKAGKFYKTRDGRKVGPIVVSSYGRGCWTEAFPSITKYPWNLDGTFLGNVESSLDLIAEWVDSPIQKILVEKKVTQTVKVKEKRIIPDEYGFLRVKDQNGANFVVADCYSASFALDKRNIQKMRDTAKALLDIADFIEGQKEGQGL